VNPDNPRDWYEYSIYQNSAGLVGLTEVKKTDGYLTPESVIPSWVLEDIMTNLSRVEDSTIFSGLSTSAWRVEYAISYEDDDVDASEVDTLITYNSARRYIMARIIYTDPSTEYDPNMIGVDNNDDVIIQETGTGIETAAETIQIPAKMSIFSSDIGSASALLSTNTTSLPYLKLYLNGKFYMRRQANDDRGALVILSRLP